MMRAIPADLLNTIAVGDCRDLARRLPDESVDMIFTDPPYHDSFGWAWAWLSEVGARVLVPGGLLLTYAGKHALPEVYAALASRLAYFWTFAAVQLNGDTRFYKRRVFSNWRPILAYYKPTADGTAAACRQWAGDARESKRDKRYHAWGQGANVCEFYLARLTLPGEVVFDPFCGGGTVPAVCKALGRSFVAFEIDRGAAEVARRRLAETNLPLFVTGPEVGQIKFSALVVRPADDESADNPGASSAERGPAYSDSHPPKLIRQRAARPNGDSARA